MPSTLPPASAIDGIEIDVFADDNCPAVICEMSAAAREREVIFQSNDGRITTLTKTAEAVTFGLFLSSYEGKVFVKDLQPGAIIICVQYLFSAPFYPYCCICYCSHCAVHAALRYDDVRMASRCAHQLHFYLSN